MSDEVQNPTELKEALSQVEVYKSEPEVAPAETPVEPTPEVTEEKPPVIA